MAILKSNRFVRFGFFASGVCFFLWGIYNGPSCYSWTSKRFWKEIPAARVVQKCLSKGAYAGARDEDGMTPLHLLVESRSPAAEGIYPYWRSIGADAEIVQLLVDAGADIEARDFQIAATPLHFALHLHSPHILLALLDAGADIEAHLEGGYTPLHKAAGSSSAEIVQALIASGADIEARNDDGLTPLHAAAGIGTVGTVRALVVSGADVDARDKTGATPLHMAAGSADSVENLQMLIEAGAHIEARAKYGMTPLHQAAAFGSAGTVRALLESGADPKAQLSDGRFPADLAEENSAVRGDPIFRELDEARSR